MEKDLSLSQLVYPELGTTFWLNVTGSTNFCIWKSKLQTKLLPRRKRCQIRPNPTVADKQADLEAHQKFPGDDFTARPHHSLFISYDHHEMTKSLLDALTSYFMKPSISKRMALTQTLRRPEDVGRLVGARICFEDGFVG
ncbi:hypothetical protein Patl1_31059 [Pistacia atlantica]|uniref:Uncharacterized protein n=1 Tax=Pistacia atlantica TaxID=434234 RepID=A0ACC1AB87_9ROSI|nr:hypothetical protein Patl1_31059 [Pistacia atlantica]